MSPRFALVALLLGLALARSAAADYQGGVAAWGRGDFTEAARQFRPAAEAGDAESQYMMGRLYSLGDGVPRDFVEAWVWFDRAARQGHGLAGEARESMNHVLNADQLAQARGIATPVPQPQVAEAAPPPVQAAPRPEVQASALPEPPRQVVVVPRRGVVESAPARLVAPGPSDVGRLMASGELPERVRSVQRSLRSTGYYTGPLDGALSGETRRAIRDYQRDAGLAQTGLLSAQLESRLGETQQAEAR